MLPECDPVTQQVIHPCREMCWSLVDACLEKWFFMVTDLGLLSRYKNSYWNRSSVIDCDYLPSLHGNIPCFYKPVICDSPPDVTDSTVVVNSTQKDVYQLHDVVQYACVNDTFKMIGNASITCRYSGQWSQSPPKCLSVNNSGMKYVHFALQVIFVLLLVIFIFIGFKYKRKSSPELKEEMIQLDTLLAQLTDSDESLLPSKRQQGSTLSLDSLPSLKRNREFDAFVLYHFDSDDDFVVNSLIPELEEVKNLRMNIHSRDFQPGCKIDENIEEAIKSSNNAVILMSAGFTTSRWCADEFTHCYIEHVEDPAFKLFVIMMEPLERLTHVTPNMRLFLLNKLIWN